MRCWRERLVGLALLAGMSMNAAAQPTAPTEPDLARQVREVERAFAATMARRDHAAFRAFLSEEAVFFSGATALRGKQAVADAWKPLYEKPQAPFSWEPDAVQVLDSGTLALSSGPVRDASGALIATFTSIWRQEAPGVWRIVFDKGNEACKCATGASAPP